MKSFILLICLCAMTSIFAISEDNKDCEFLFSGLAKQAQSVDQSEEIVSNTNKI